MSEIEAHLHRMIVVVDDNPRFLILIKSMLREFGFDFVEVFTDAAEAFRFASRVHVDVILTDLVMKPISGIQLADRLRHADVVVNRVVPLILLTGHAGRENIQKAINHGIDEVLAKPFSARQLYERLMGVLERPRVYIKTASGYFGPDRRRRDDPRYTGPERRRRNEAAVITLETLIEMREETRRKYGKLPKSPLDPAIPLAPVLVGPITTIPLTVITTPDGARPVARVPTPMRAIADAVIRGVDKPVAVPVPPPADADRLQPALTIPVAPPPPPKPEPAPLDVHFLD